MTAEPGPRLRLLSWNMHKAIGGVDRRCSLERVAAVVHHYRPDVVALQEVDDGVPRSHGAHQAHELSHMLGLPHVVFGPTVKLRRGRYGNATLSLHPISASHRIDLTFPLKKVRSALHTELSVSSGGHQFALHLLNWHLGLSGVERRWQVKRMLEHPRVRRLTERSRIVIAGDTNDWAGALPGGRLATAGFQCATGTGRSALRTFPALQPLGALDRVFVRGPLEAGTPLRPRLGLARLASDHLPVVLDLELRRS